MVSNGAWLIPITELSVIRVWIDVALRDRLDSHKRGAERVRQIALDPAWLPDVRWPPAREARPIQINDFHHVFSNSALTRIWFADILPVATGTRSARSAPSILWPTGNRHQSRDATEMSQAS